MTPPTEKQRTLEIEREIDAFLRDRMASGRSAGTVRYYSSKLDHFCAFCLRQGIDRLFSLRADHLRIYLLELADDHNAGGVAGFYRAVRALMRWYENEFEPDDWRNPVNKVRMPRVPEQVLEPVSAEAVSALLRTCARGNPTDGRDRAILLTLYDTGLRAKELTALDVADFDQANSALVVRQGKNRKPRVVFVGKKARRAIRAYLGKRKQGALFTTRSGDRLTYAGLRSMLQRRSEAARLAEPPTLHSFRRANALNLLRAGVDLISVQRLLGHANLSVIKQYLAQTVDDLQAAHRQASPADRL